MSITFDHLIVLVHDLDTASRDYQALGFTVQERHDTEHGKTRFRFISFDEGSYILLTAFASAADQASHRLGEVLAAGEGWADWSFVVPDASAIAAALASFPQSGPGRVSNVIADGRTWALDLLMFGRGAGGDVCLPFVVSDVEGRSARIPGPVPHANGATGIVGLRLSSADPVAVGNILMALGGTAATPCRYDFGAIWVEVLPLDAEGGRPGGGMVEAVLSGPAAQVLDLHRAHGAPLRIEVV